MANPIALMAGVSAGAGIVIASYLAVVYQIVQNRKTNISASGYKTLLDRSRSTRQMQRKYTHIISWLKSRNIKERLAVVTITLLMIGTVDRAASIPRNALLGMVLGLVILKFFEKVRRDVDKAKKLKEIAILFESVEMYSRAGYSLVQALRASKMLTNEITGAIDQCLSRWGSNPKVALEKLKDDLGLEESDALILMMMHMEIAGVKNMQGILKREAHNIERMQRMKTEIKISQRPLILMVYRILPMASVIGIIVGSLLFRMYQTLVNMGLLGITLTP